MGPKHSGLSGSHDVIVHVIIQPAIGHLLLLVGGRLEPSLYLYRFSRHSAQSAKPRAHRQTPNRYM